MLSSGQKSADVSQEESVKKSETSRRQTERALKMGRVGSLEMSVDFNYTALDPKR